MNIITLALISKKAAFHLQSYIRKKHEKINEHYYSVFTVTKKKIIIKF